MRTKNKGLSTDLQNQILTNFRSTLLYRFCGHLQQQHISGKCSLDSQEKPIAISLYHVLYFVEQYVQKSSFHETMME